MNDNDSTIRVPDAAFPKKRRSAFTRVIGSLFGLLILFGILVAAAGVWTYGSFTAPGPLAAAKIYQVSRGLSAPEVGVALNQQGIINDPRVFTLAAYGRSLFGSRIKAGEYEFPKGASMEDVLAILASGRAITYKLTIPEGWTSEMALARIASNEVLEGEVPPLPPEASLMPDTYVFQRGMTRAKLVEDMQAVQAKMLDELWAARSPDTAAKTKEEAVTLASIVEKETGIPEERPQVASVFSNRIKQGMRLQSDPTIIYGLVGGKGKLDRRLTKADIASATPYNTYVIDGLPPGPIASPGRAALEAVLNPAKTEYLYFVADGSGGHAFAATLDEHNANVKKWREVSSSAAAEEPDAPAAAAEEPDAAAIDQNATAPALPSPAEEQPAEAPAVATAEPEAKPAEAKPVEAKPAEAKPAEKKPAETADKKIPKPGSVIMVADKLVPIPKQKPKR